MNIHDNDKSPQSWRMVRKCTVCELGREFQMSLSTLRHENPKSLVMKHCPSLFIQSKKNRFTDYLWYCIYVYHFVFIKTIKYFQSNEGFLHIILDTIPALN